MHGHLRFPTHKQGGCPPSGALTHLLPTLAENLPCGREPEGSHLWVGPWLAVSEALSAPTTADKVPKARLGPSLWLGLGFWVGQSLIALGNFPWSPDSSPKDVLSTHWTFELLWTLAGHTLITWPQCSRNMHKSWWQETIRDKIMWEQPRINQTKNRCPCRNSTHSVRTISRAISFPGPWLSCPGMVPPSSLLQIGA